MDKYEYRVKTEQMLEYVNKKAYDKAMEIADTIDWRKVKNIPMLNSVSEIYEVNGEYQKSRDVLFIAYDRAPSSRKIVYRLGILALKMNDISEAMDCYEEFIGVAPKDPNQFILRYKILKAQKAPVEQQIDALEEFKKAEYIEKWAYELAKLYHEAGRTAECLEECDDLILWFSEGKYVYKAMELKMRYKPLTPLQKEKYEQRFEDKKKKAPVKEAEEKTAEEQERQEAPASTAEVESDLEMASDILETEEERPVEKQITGQMSIEEILEGWEAKQKEIVEANEEARRNESAQKIIEKAQKKLQDTASILPDEIQRLIDDIENEAEGSAAEEEPKAEEPVEEEEAFEEEPIENMGALVESLTVDDDEYEEEDYEEEDYEEEDYEEAEYESEEDYEEEDYEEAEYESGEDYEEEDYEEAEYESEEDYGEEDYEEAEYESEEDYGEEDYEEAEYESEEDYGEEDFEEAEFAEESEEIEEVYDVLIDEAQIEDPAFEEVTYAEEEQVEFSGLDSDDEEELYDDDFNEAYEDIEDEAEEPEEAVTEEEPIEIEEPNPQVKRSPGGVVYDTGFVVQGRYDLEAQSEIGLKAGLTEEQKRLFSYFVPIRGMSEQLVEVLDADKKCKNRFGTSRTGNLLIIGRKGSGKTVLAVDVVKAIQKQRKIKQGKVAIITGESLNKKELTGIVQKLKGGALIIEKAGKLNARTIRELNDLMEEQTEELLFVLEEQRKPLEKMLNSNLSFKKKFTSKLELPVFINDELVTFGQTYAKENGYRIDEMGILALYSRIDMMQKEDHAVTVAEVKEIMDEAIAHSQKANMKHFVKRVFGKGTDDTDRIILKEDDFRI